MKNTNENNIPDYVLHNLGGKLDAYHEVLNALYAAGPAQGDAWNIVYKMFMNAEREYEQAFDCVHRQKRQSDNRHAWKIKRGFLLFGINTC